MIKDMIGPNVSVNVSKPVQSSHYSSVQRDVMVTNLMLIAEDCINLVLKFCLAVHLLLQQVSEEQSYCKSVVKKQQQQAQLRKLPRHHPLIREVHSDTGMQLHSSP